MTDHKSGMGDNTFVDGEAALLLAGEDLLARDNIPDKNQRLECFSCHTPYVGVFCHACGQKNDNMRRSLVSLIIEMAGNITAFDSRIWRTWVKLLTRPGLVAREYADGRRMKWTSPVRAYLAMSILLFGYIALTGTQIVSLTMDVERDDGAPAALSELKPSNLKTEFNLLMFETNTSLAARREAANTDLVDYLLNYPEPLSFYYHNGTMKLVEEGYLSESDEAGKKGYDSSQLAIEQFVEDAVEGTVRSNRTLQESDPEATDVESAQSSGNLNESERQNVVSIGNNIYSAEEASTRSVAALKLMLSRPKIFNAYFSTYLPRVMLCMMPFTMFLGILFIRGRGNALLYDHLVHAAYIHAVFFFLLFIGLVLGQHTPIPSGWLMALLALYMILYLPMSMGGMFHRGPIKTVWSSYAIGFVYFITITVIITTLTVMAFIGVIEQTQYTSFSY